MASACMSDFGETNEGFEGFRSQFAQLSPPAGVSPVVSMNKAMPEPAKKPQPAIEIDPESDPVWDLIDKAPTQPASVHFARETVQLVRQAREPRESWWQKLMTPVQLTGLAAAAVAVALVIGFGFPGAGNGKVVTSNGEKAAALTEILETEMLMAAADNPSEFSDQELVYLLGF